MSVDPSLSALRDPARGHVRALATIVVDHALATPITDLLPAPTLTARIRAALGEAAERPDLRAAVNDAVAAARSKAQGDGRALRELLLPGVEPAVREALALRWSPSEALVLRIINQPAMRELVASVLSETLHGFTARLKSADKGLLGGLGERTARRGSGLFGALAGGISEAAGGIVGAVRDELGSAMETKVREFVESATEQAVRGIAAWLAEPQHADRLAVMRAGVLDVVLALTVREVAQEVEELDTDAITERVLAALRDMARDPEAEAHLTRAAEEALDLLPDRTLGALAARYGLDTPVRELTAAWLEPQLTSLVSSAPFEAWWRAIHTEVGT